MICKFCNGELPEDVTLCPCCGKENLDDTIEQVSEITEETVAEMTEEPAAEIAEEAASEIAEEAAEVTEEETVEMPEEAPKKKPKTWLMVLAAIGALAIAFVLGMAVYYGVSTSMKAADSYTVSDAKAEKARDTVVATVGDMQLTNSELHVFYQQTVEDFYNYYGYYMDASTLDLSKPLDQQYYDEEAGITWQKYFLDSALSTWGRYAALNMQGREDGFQLDEGVQAYLNAMEDEIKKGAEEQGFDSADAMISASMGAGCDEAGYYSFLHTNIYAGQYLDSRYESLVPTMEEIEAYYKENETALAAQGIADDGSVTVDVRHILICPKGGTTDENGGVTYSEAEWELCRQEAQDLLDQWAAESGTEEGFAEYAAQYTEDPGSMSTGGLYTDVYVGQMVEPFETWCFDASRKYGDTGLVQTNYGYHIMYFVEAREVWISSVHDTIINERSLAIVNDAVAKWPMDANYKKIAISEIKQ